MDLTIAEELIMVVIFVSLGILFGYLFFEKNINIMIVLIIFMILIAYLFEIVSDIIGISSIMILFIVIYANIRKKGVD